MGKLDLFYTSKNYLFWERTQILIVSEAWDLVKTDQANKTDLGKKINQAKNLFSLYKNCDVLTPLEDMGTSELLGDNIYISDDYGSNDHRRDIERYGMNGFAFDLASPLSKLVKSLKPFEKLKVFAPGKSIIRQEKLNTIEYQVQKRIVSIIIHDEYELQKTGSSKNLWEYWQKSNEFLHIVPSKKLRNIIMPYYRTFYNKNNLANNADKIVTILPSFGFDNWPRNDYEHQPKKEKDGTYPSFIDQILLAYIKSLMFTNVNDNAIKYIKAGIKALEDHYDNSEYYNWIVYNFGKLLFKLKRYDELSQLKEKIINIVKKNSQTAYFWSLLAKCYTNTEQDAQLALLEMSVSCPNASQNDANQLISLLSNNYNNGEVQLILNGLVQKFPKLKRSDIKVTNEQPEDLSKLLRDQAKEKVGQLLFSDSQKDFYVEWNNVEKTSTGIFYSRLDTSPTKIHDPKLATKVQEGKCYSAIIVHGEYYGNLKECENDDLLSKFRKSVQEHLMIPRDSTYHYEENYGFLEPSNTFVSPEIIKKYNLNNYDIISGTIVSRWKNNKIGTGKFKNELVQVDSIKNLPKEERFSTAEGHLNFTESRNGYDFIFLVRKDGGEDVLVPSSILHNKFSDDQHVSAELERSWDRKRGQWTWKASHLTALE